MLVGEGTGPFHREAAQQLGWGRMWIARDRNIYTEPGEPWGLDNGAFRDWTDRAQPMDPDRFDGDTFRRVLDKALAQPTPPLLAVIPDAPGNAAGTLRMADEWLPRLPDFPWYMAVQDGMDPRDVDDYELAGIFLGGTDAFKAEAPRWCEYAHARGIPFHYGRCGTAGKIEHALEVGADSLDSAFPMWTRERWAWFVDVMTNGLPQLTLSLACEEERRGRD